MLTPEQCRAARGWLDWSQDDLARAAGVSLSTIRDFEKERRLPIENNLEAMEKALEAAGVTIDYNATTSIGLTGTRRISEQDLTIPALEALNMMEEGWLKISELKSMLMLMLHPEGEDLEILENRSDTKFSQIVRNLVSHRSSPTNLIGAGYATYDKINNSLAITELGREFLQKSPPLKTKTYSRA